MQIQNIKLKIIFLAIILFGLFGLAKGSQAANHYVRDGGTGDCSDWTTACNDLPTTLTRGDTYYIADGSYSGRTFNTAVSGSTYITIKKATVADHGTATGWSDSYGTTQATFSYQLDFESSYWIFDGVTGGGPGQWGSNYGFKITEVTDSNATIKTGWSANVDFITIKHVELQGKGSVANTGGAASNDGLAIYGTYNWTYYPQGITVSYAWMHDLGRCPIFIAARGSGTEYLFEYLYVTSYHNSDGVHSEIMSASNLHGDITFRNSLITDVEGTGGLMWDNSANTSTHLYIYGNVFYKPSGASWLASNGIIGGWTGGAGEACYGLRVYNNTFINITGTNGGIFGISNMYNHGDNIAENNIFYNSDSPDYTLFSTHDYNHYISSGGSHSEAHGTSATSGDQFVDYINLNFALTSATSAGLTLSSPYNLDPLGNTRGADGTWDRGAYEYTSGGGGDTTAPAAPSGLSVQ